MKSLADLTPNDRILIVAPHPDDESLASAGLIQQAREMGAGVHVLFASNGDKNPWPQRFKEWKIRITQEDGARWGKLRKSEAGLALEYLGMCPETSAAFLDLPDLSFTTLLMNRDQTVILALQKKIEEFQPTWIILPSLYDRHPDHSALAVFGKIALSRSSVQPECLHYAIHEGRLNLSADTVSLPLTKEQRDKKRGAILKHASQMLLSRRRFLGYAKPEEIFHREAAKTDLPQHQIAAAQRMGDFLELKITLPAAPSNPQILLALEDAGEGLRLKLDLPRRSGQIPLLDAVSGKEISSATVKIQGQECLVCLPIGNLRPIKTLFAKWQTSTLFLDEAGWREVPIATEGQKRLSISPEKAAAPMPGYPRSSTSRVWLACSFLLILWLGFILTRNIARPWVDVVDYNGAVWSQAAHNILRAGFAETFGASTGFYFGPLPIPPSGFYLHHPPLLHLILTLMFDQFGEHEWVARMLPIGASLLSCTLLWLLVSSCAGLRTATFSLALFAFMPMELRYGQMVNFEPIILPLILGGLLSFRYWKLTGNAAWKWGGVACFVAGLGVDWAMYLFVIIMSLLWLRRSGEGSRRVAWLLLTATCLFGLLHLARIQLLRPDALSDLTHTFFKRVGSQSNVHFTEAQWLNRISDYLTSDYLPFVWLLVAAGAAVIFRKRAENPGLGYLGWVSILIAAMDLVFIGAFQNDSYIHRYIAYYLLAPVAILGGVALNQFVEWEQATWRIGALARPVVPAAICVLLLIGGYIGERKADALTTQFRILDAQAKEPRSLIPDLGWAIRNTFPPKARILCNFLPNYGPHLGYYAQRTLLNNVLENRYWQNFLQNSRNRDLSGLVWLNSESSRKLAAQLPGRKVYLTIDGLPFCAWNPSASIDVPALVKGENLSATPQKSAGKPAAIRTPQNKTLSGIHSAESPLAAT